MAGRRPGRDEDIAAIPGREETAGPLDRVPDAGASQLHGAVFRRRGGVVCKARGAH